MVILLGSNIYSKFYYTLLEDNYLDKGILNSLPAWLNMSICLFVSLLLSLETYLRTIVNSSTVSYIINNLRLFYSGVVVNRVIGVR